MPRSWRASWRATTRCAPSIGSSTWADCLFPAKVRLLLGGRCSGWRGAICSVIEESFSLYGPASLPMDSARQLAGLTHQMLAQADTQARLAQMGLEVAPQQPAQFKASLKALHGRWGGIVKASGFTPQD